MTVPSFLPTGSSYTTPTQRPAGRSADHHTVSARAFKDSTDTFEDGRRAPRAGADSKHRRRGHAPGRSSPRKAISPAMPSTSTRSPTVIGAAIISSAPLHLRCRSEWRERSSISEGTTQSCTCSRNVLRGRLRRQRRRRRRRCGADARGRRVLQVCASRSRVGVRKSVCIYACVCVCVLCMCVLCACTSLQQAPRAGAGVHVRARLR